MNWNSRAKRADKIVSYLRKSYPQPKSELKWKAPFQFVVALILSAQCTDKVVNRVTEKLFRKYKTAFDFAHAKPQTFEREISSVQFFRNKAKHIIAYAKKVRADFKGL